MVQKSRQALSDAIREHPPEANLAEAMAAFDRAIDARPESPREHEAVLTTLEAIGTQVGPGGAFDGLGGRRSAPWRHECALPEGWPVAAPQADAPAHQRHRVLRRRTPPISERAGGVVPRNAALTVQGIPYQL